MKKPKVTMDEHELILTAFKKVTDIPKDAHFLMRVRKGEPSRPMGTLLNDPIGDIIRAASTENRAKIKRRQKKVEQDIANIKKVLIFLGTSGFNSLSSKFGQEMKSEDQTLCAVILAIGDVRSARIGLKLIVAGMYRFHQSMNEQLDEIGSVGPGRQKKAAAHKVAEVTAKAFANVTGERPTYSEKKGDVFGKFTPLLQEVFEILGIKAGLKGPAEAARDSITAEDLNWKRPLHQRPWRF